MQKNILVFLIFALFVAIFSIQNASTVSISFFNWQYQVSLVIIVLGAIVLGAIIMGLITYITQIKLRRKLRSLQRENQKLEETNRILEERIEQLTKENEVEKIDSSNSGQENIEEDQSENIT